MKKSAWSSLFRHPTPLSVGLMLGSELIVYALTHWKQETTTESGVIDSVVEKGILFKTNEISFKVDDNKSTRAMSLHDNPSLLAKAQENHLKGNLVRIRYARFFVTHPLKAESDLQVLDIQTVLVDSR